MNYIGTCKNRTLFRTCTSDMAVLTPTPTVGDGLRECVVLLICVDVDIYVCIHSYSTGLYTLLLKSISRVWYVVVLSSCSSA